MRKAFLLLTAMLLFGFFQILSISALTTHVVSYNFTNLSDRVAWFGKPKATNPWNTTAPSANASGPQYTAMQTRDGSFANSTAGGANDFPFWRFNFTVLEVNASWNQINWMTVNITGKGNGTGAEAGNVSLWNFTSASFVSVGTFTGTNANISMNYTGQANASDFVQRTTKNIFLFIEGTLADSNEGVSIDFVQIDFLLVDDPPRWSSNSTNATTAGATINHSVFWTDDVTLNTSVFSLDNGNGSFLNFTTKAVDSTNWTNFSYVINSTGGSTIRWIVYTNDSSNNINATSTFQYTTTTDSCSCPAVNNNWLVINGDQCTLTTTCNLGTGTLRVLSGALRINGGGILNANHCFVQNAQRLFVLNGGKLSCR